MSKLNFTIGADPEISLLYGNKRIDANQFLYKCTKLGHQSNTQIVFPEGIVGVDGCSSTAELRPQFSDDPYIVANNVGKLIAELHKITNILEMNTTSFYAPIGGHIHLSVMKTDDMTKLSEVERNRITTRMTKFMALFQLPMLASYNRQSELIRTQCYGNITDSRFENRAGTYCMEYRAPNAEWLTNEKICKATIVYYAMIHNEVLNHYDDFNNRCEPILASSKQQYSYLQNLVLTDYAKLSEKIIANIIKIAKTCELYQEYKADIDYILDYKQVYKDKESVEFNIGKGWNLVEKTNITKKKMFNEKLISENIKDKNLDTLANFLDIAYNKDHNCQAFANALARRSVAYNWKFKHYYFIYGLRKGINDYIISDENFDIYKKISQLNGSNDVTNLKNLLNRINMKFANAIYSENKTSSLKLSQFLGKKVFFIGIPYDERDKMKTKNFLNTIFSLEKDILKPIDLNVSYGKANGDLTKILTQEDKIEEVIDKESQGARYADQAINELANQTSSVIN